MKKLFILAAFILGGFVATNAQTQPEQKPAQSNVNLTPAKQEKPEDKKAEKKEDKKEEKSCCKKGAEEGKSCCKKEKEDKTCSKENKKSCCKKEAKKEGEQ